MPSDAKMWASTKRRTEANQYLTKSNTYGIINHSMVFPVLLEMKN